MHLSIHRGFAARCSAVSLVLSPFLSIASAAVPAGVGLAGDSLTDEYQFPLFFPSGGDRRLGGPTQNGLRNVPVLLQQARGLNLGAFSSVSLGAPRNEGYAFNWAMDGSTSADLLAGGQHTGLATQAAAGSIDLAVIVIGVNDFRAGVFDPGSIANIPAALLNNVGTAVTAVLQSNPNARVVIGNVPDIRHVPALNPAPPVLLDALTQAINGYNAALAGTFAGNNRVAIADLNSALNGFVADPTFATRTYNLEVSGDDPLSNFWVDDLHPGRLGQALLANSMISAADARFGYTIGTLSATEIEASVPEPAFLGIAIASLLGQRRRRS